MRKSVFALAALVLILGCGKSSDPTSPEMEGDPSTPGVEVEPDDRELTGLISGSTTLNGSVVTDPDYDNQPYGRSMDARAGELAFFSHKAAMSDASTTTLAVSYEGATRTYGSTTTSTGPKSTFEVRYITRNEALTLNLWNSSTVNGPLKAAAASWDYTFKTAARQGTGEPNSDNLTENSTDRNMANLIALNTLVSRSMFYNTPTDLDVEDWYKVDLALGLTYRLNLSTFNPRYGTWKYRMHVRNAAGSLVGSMAYIQTNQTTVSLEITAATTGTYYIQIAGYQSTKTQSSNVYYTPYTLQVSPIVPSWFANWGGIGGDRVNAIDCAVDAVGNAYIVGAFLGGVDFDPGAGSANRNSTALESGYCLALSPSGTYRWVAVLQSDNACGAWGVGLTPDGAPRITGYFRGLTDFDPSNGNSPSQSSGQEDVFCLALTSAGAYEWHVFAAGSAGSSEFGQAVEVDQAGGVRVVGDVRQEVDFDPGPGEFLRGNDGPFCWALSPTGALQWAVGIESLGGTPTGGYGLAKALALTASGAPRLVGTWVGDMDFDPDAGTQIRSSDNDVQDAYCLALTPLGAYEWVATWGDFDDDVAYGVGLTSGGAPRIAGTFHATVDFDPGVPVQPLSAAGELDAFLLGLTAAGVYEFAMRWGGPDDDYANAVAVDSTGASRVAGQWQGLADFDPGAGAAPKTSLGVEDAYCLALSPTGGFQWVATVEGTARQKANAVRVTNTNGVRFCGDFSGLTNFRPTGAGGERTPIGNPDGYLLALTPGGTW